MKSIVWTVAVVTILVLTLIPAPRPAYAFEVCQERICKLNNDCSVECPPCTGSPAEPGVCWYGQQD